MFVLVSAFHWAVACVGASASICVAWCARRCQFTYGSHTNPRRVWSRHADNDCRDRCWRRCVVLVWQQRNDEFASRRAGNRTFLLLLLLLFVCLFWQSFPVTKAGNVTITVTNSEEAPFVQRKYCCFCCWAQLKPSSQKLFSIYDSYDFQIIRATCEVETFPTRINQTNSNSHLSNVIINTKFSILSIKQ